jgi:hypothetical protein
VIGKNSVFPDGFYPITTWNVRKRAILTIVNVTEACFMA